MAFNLKLGGKYKVLLIEFYLTLESNSRCFSLYPFGSKDRALFAQLFISLNVIVPLYGEFLRYMLSATQEAENLMLSEAWLKLFPGSKMSSDKELLMVSAGSLYLK